MCRALQETAGTKGAPPALDVFCAPRTQGLRPGLTYAAPTALGEG
jgi:hypothetical protein